MTRAMRIAHISDAPIPYDTPVFNHLNRLADLHVIYLAPAHTQFGFGNAWSEPPAYPYSTRRSRSINLPGRDLWTQLSPGVSLDLQRRKPDVITFKSWNLTSIEPLLWKLAARRRCVMWAESTAVSGVLRGRVSNTLRSTILGMVDAFVSNGSLATSYLQDLGVPADRIVTSCLASPLADAAVASNAASAPSAEPAEGPRFLFVGRLIERKRPLAVLDAFAHVLTETPTARLLVVGDGPLLEATQQAADRLGDRVTVLGRREGAELAASYRQADILVVPSVREVWGLIVNEGLAFGLHVIATDEVASAHDLIDRESGVIVPADDPAALAAAMRAAARGVQRDPARRARRAERVAPHTTAAFAADLYRAAELALAQGERVARVSAPQ